MASNVGPRSRAEHLYMDQERKWYGTWIQDDNKEELAAFFGRAKDANKRIRVVHLFLWQEIRILEFLRRKYSTPQYSNIDFIRASEEWSEDEAVHRYIWNWADEFDITEEDRTFFIRMLQYWLTKDRAPRKAGYLDDGTISRNNLLYRDPFDIGPSLPQGPDQGGHSGVSRPSNSTDQGNVNHHPSSNTRGKARQQPPPTENTNAFELPYGQGSVNIFQQPPAQGGADTFRQAPDQYYDSDSLINQGKDSIPNLYRRFSNLRDFSGPAPDDRRSSRPHRSGQNAPSATASGDLPPVLGQHTRPIDPPDNVSTSSGFIRPLSLGDRELRCFTFGQQHQSSELGSGQAPAPQQPHPQQPSSQQQSRPAPAAYQPYVPSAQSSSLFNSPAPSAASPGLSRQQQQRPNMSAQSGSIPPQTGASGQAPQSRPAQAAQQPYVSPGHNPTPTQPAPQFSQQAPPGFQQQALPGSQQQPPPGFPRQAPPGFSQQPPPGFQQSPPPPSSFQSQGTQQRQSSGHRQQPPPPFRSQTQGPQHGQSSGQGHPRQHVPQAPSRPLAQGYGIYQQPDPNGPPHPYRQAQTPQQLQRAAEARVRMSGQTNVQLYRQLYRDFGNLNLRR